MVHSESPRLFSPRRRQLSWPQSPALTNKSSTHKVSFVLSRPRAISTPFNSKFQQHPQRPISAPLVGCLPRNKLKRGPGTVSMTSFPRLASRSCTNDWLTPLGLSEELESEESPQTATDLYHRGIDAHSGVHVNNQLPVLLENSHSSSSATGSFSLRDHSSSHQWYENQWSDQRHEKRLGRAIGSAARRRIGSVKSSQVEHHGHTTTTNLLDRLRRYSFIPLPEQTTEHTRKDGPSQPPTVEIPPNGDGERKRSSQELLQEILNRSDPSSMKSSRSKSSTTAVPNTARTRESSRQRSIVARLPCSEDMTPHVCTDELWTPWTDSSYS